MSNVVTFEKEAKEEVLDAFGKMIDSEGYIVEKDNPTQRVLTPEGDFLEIQDFAGIKKGSLVFLKSDINSLIDLSDTIKE